MERAQIFPDIINTHTILQKRLNFKGISILFLFFVNYARTLCQHCYVNKRIKAQKRIYHFRLLSKMWYPTERQNTKC